MGICSRRNFLANSARITGLALGTFALGHELMSPVPGRAAEISFPQSSCGRDSEKGRRILVAYASRHGSTAGVAEAVGKTLCDGGANVDIRIIKNVDDPYVYDAVIIGSPIHTGKWLPEAVEFIEKHRTILKERPVAYFVTCITLFRDTEPARKKAEAFLNPVKDAYPDIRPVSTGLFGGVLDYNRYSFVIRMIMKQKMKDAGVPEGDYRDWEAIRGWAQGVRPSLLGPA